ncbi:hypothetical protein ABI59_03750 [Acidobacteria bacterium Mor1]|nr:hypothetical protein ABI59_03750 [Acidobacteria bacterium Mor1]
MKLKASLLLWVLAALGLAGAVSAEERILVEEAAGILELEGERRLRIEGAYASLRVRAGKAGELRFLSTPAGKPKDELPIPLYTDGSTLWFRTDPEAVERGSLEVAVPEEMSVVVDVEGGELVLSGLFGDVEAVAVDAETSVRQLRGLARLELYGGTVKVSGLAQGLELEVAEGVRGSVTAIAGGLSLAISESELELQKIEGDFQGSVEDGALKLVGSSGKIELEASGSRLDLESITEAALRLTRSPLEIRGASGLVSIDSDAAVTVEGNEAEVEVTGFGAEVVLNDSRGPVKIRTSGGRIEVQTAVAPIDVEGDRLVVEMGDLKEALEMRLTDSEVLVENSGGAVTIENDFGPVELSKIRGMATVTNRDGDVLISDASAAMALEVENGAVDIAWESLGGKENSTIRAEGGDVTLRLPDSGGCRLEISAGGRVESEHPDVRVSDDGRSASGAINRFSRPLVKVDSDATVYVSTLGGG